MIQIVRGKYVLVVDQKEARLIRTSDSLVMLTARDPQAIEALIDCFSEDIPEPVKQIVQE